MALRGKNRATILAEYALRTENFITWEEAERRFPEWCRNRPRSFKHLLSRKARAFRSKFQTTRHLVALRYNPATGQMEPDFDRVIVEEARNVHINAYSIDPDGTYWFGIIYQIRPFVEGQRPALVAEIPKGFALDAVLGKGASRLLELTLDEHAARELAQELGLPLVGSPKFLRRMRKGNTFDAQSVSDIFEAQVDRHAVVREVDTGEGILASEMIPLAEYGRRVRAGTDEDGIQWDTASDMATFQCFLMEHPEAAYQFYGGMVERDILVL